VDRTAATLRSMLPPLGGRSRRAAVNNGHRARHLRIGGNSKGDVAMVRSGATAVVACARCSVPSAAVDFVDRLPCSMVER